MEPRSENPRMMRALGLALAMALLATTAACGDDDSSSEGTTIQSDADGLLDGDGEVVEDDDAGDEAASQEVDGMLGECAQAITAIGQTAAGLTVPGDDGAGVEALADVTPDELQGEVSTLSDSVEQMQAAFADAGVEGGDRDGIEAVEDDNEEVLDAARDALDEIQANFEETCESR